MLRYVGLLAVVLPVLFAADPAYQSAEAKLDRIQNLELKPGEGVLFTPREIEAWVRVTVPDVMPEGIRDPRLEVGTDTATAYAMVDFLKMRQARGAVTNRLLAKMIEGEHPLKVSVKIASGGGRCTIYLTRVELAGGVAEGGVLDFLIKTFFLPLYPDAKIDQPFDLDFNMDRIDFLPEGIRVTAKK